MEFADRHLHADAENDAWDDAHQHGNEWPTMNHLHALIDAHAERAKQELHDMTQEAIDAITVKCGWFVRSDAQRRRWEKAKREVRK